MLLFPRHCTLRSIISATVRGGIFESAAQAVDHLGRDVPLDGYLGECAHQVGLRFFQSDEAGRILLRHHSHIGLFGNLLADDDEDDLRDGLIDGDSNAIARARALRAQGPLESDTLRRCPQCVDDDLANYGLAHWRLYHQWPIAQHCVIHGCELQDRCAHCGSQIWRGASLALPHDSCERWGRAEFVGTGSAQVPIYEQTLRRLHSMLVGCVPSMRPERRAATALHAKRALYGHMHLGGLIGFACAQWNCASVAELAQKFGCVESDEMLDDVGDIEAPDSLPAILVTAVATAVHENV